MTGTARGAQQWLARWPREAYAYLTTTGRRSGRPHRIEIWFAVGEDRMYLLSGGRGRSDWVRNLVAEPRVRVELGDKTRQGIARVAEEGADEDRRARELLVAKYATPTHTLADWNWKRRSLAVAIAFAPGGTEPPETERNPS